MMSPAGGRHGRIAARIGKLMAIHVDEYQLGECFAAETGFVLSRNPDTVRAPDVAFVSQEKMAALQDDSGFLPFAPDLAVEVVSPNDSFAEVEGKAWMWIASGTRLVLIVEPESETVYVYRAGTDIQVLDPQSVLDATDVVPGWRVQVADFFPS